MNKKFALIGHPADYNHFIDYLNFLGVDSDKAKYRSTLIKIFEWSRPFKAAEIKSFTSKTGKKIDGIFVTCPILPEMVTLTPQLASKKVYDSCFLAEKLGANIITLGGFTSIVVGDQGKDLLSSLKTNVTSGNTLTAKVAIEKTLQVIEEKKVDLDSAVLAILGASGDIGLACAKYFSKRAKKIILTARNIKRLELLAENYLNNSNDVDIEITGNNKKAVERADIVISTASSITNIVELSDFKEKTIVCDVGYPKNVFSKFSKRKDLIVFAGGLLEMPDKLDFGFNMLLPNNRITYGCFAEAIILALEGNFTPFSIGRGNITEEKMDYIYKMALKHGFRITGQLNRRIR